MSQRAASHPTHALVLCFKILPGLAQLTSSALHPPKAAQPLAHGEVGRGSPCDSGSSLGRTCSSMGRGKVLNKDKGCVPIT